MTLNEVIKVIPEGWTLTEFSLSKGQASISKCNRTLNLHNGGWYTSVDGTMLSALTPVVLIERLRSHYEKCIAELK